MWEQGIRITFLNSFSEKRMSILNDREKPWQCADNKGEKEWVRKVVYMTEGGGALLTVLVFGFNKWQNSLPFNKLESITAGLDIHYELTKIICQQTRRATTIPRPPLESSWRGEFRSSGFHFLWSFFDLIFFLPRSRALLRCLGSMKNSFFS